MELTAHAEARAQQRGFTEKDLEIIVSLGGPEAQGGWGGQVLPHEGREAEGGDEPEAPTAETRAARR